MNYPASMVWGITTTFLFYVLTSRCWEINPYDPSASLSTTVATRLRINSANVFEAKINVSLIKVIFDIIKKIKKLSISSYLKDRSNSECELCSSESELSCYIVPPRKGEEIEEQVAVVKHVLIR